MDGKKMLTMQLLVLISIVMPLALLLAEEHRMRTEWRECWANGKSGIASRMALLS